MSDAVYKIRKTTLDSIADAIRAKTNKTDLISPLDMAEEILLLQLGDIDFAAQTIEEKDVEKGKIFYNKYGLLSTGTGKTIIPSDVSIHIDSRWPNIATETDIFYNTTTKKYYMYIENNWIELNQNDSSLLLYSHEGFDSLAEGWVDKSGNDTGIIDNGTLTKSFNSYINDRLKNMIDVTDYDRLTVVVNSITTGSSRTPFFGLWTTNPGNTANTATNFEAYTALTKQTARRTYSIDISSLSGRYYIGLSLGMGDNYNSSYSIESIILEKTVDSSEISLIHNGQIYDAVDGQWFPIDTSSATNSYFITNGDYVTVQGDNSVKCMQKAMDLTNISTLIVEMALAETSPTSNTKSNSGLIIAAYAGAAYTIREAQVKCEATTRTTYTLDVSSFTGVHMVRLQGYASGLNVYSLKATMM